MKEKRKNFHNLYDLVSKAKQRLESIFSVRKAL